MPTLVSVAAAIAAAAGIIQAAAPPIGGMRYGKLRYDVRAVQQAVGLGGQPAYCAQNDEELLMVVYSVRNDGELRSAPAVPRLVILDPRGLPVQPDRRMTDALTFKVNPPITLRGGQLPSNSLVVLADVFITPRGKINVGRWKIRPDRPGAETTTMAMPKMSQTPECVR